MPCLGPMYGWCKKYLLQCPISHFPTQKRIFQPFHKRKRDGVAVVCQSVSPILSDRLPPTLAWSGRFSLWRSDPTVFLIVPGHYGLAHLVIWKRLPTNWKESILRGGVSVLYAVSHSCVDFLQAVGFAGAGAGAPGAGLCELQSWPRPGELSTCYFSRPSHSISFHFSLNWMS